ncbi:MAG: hypothetical protein ACYDC3_16035 [Candidatus Binataceae bacterium]
MSQFDDERRLKVESLALTLGRGVALAPPATPATDPAPPSPGTQEPIDPDDKSGLAAERFFKTGFSLAKRAQAQQGAGDSATALQTFHQSLAFLLASCDEAERSPSFATDARILGMCASTRANLQTLSADSQFEIERQQMAVETSALR